MQAPELVFSKLLFDKDATGTLEWWYRWSSTSMSITSSVDVKSNREMIAPKLISILRRNQVNRSRLYLKLHFIVSGSFNGLYLVDIINIYIFFSIFPNANWLHYITIELFSESRRSGIEKGVNWVILCFRWCCRNRMGRNNGSLAGEVGYEIKQSINNGKFGPGITYWGTLTSDVCGNHPKVSQWNSPSPSSFACCWTLHR